MRKLIPSDIKSEIKSIRAHLDMLEAYVDCQKRRHRKMDDGNGTYDPVSYPCFQIMLHTALIRECLNLHKSYEGCDGKGKRMMELNDGTMFASYGGKGYAE